MSPKLLCEDCINFWIELPQDDSRRARRAVKHRDQCVEWNCDLCGDGNCELWVVPLTADEFGQAELLLHDHKSAGEVEQ